MMRKMSVSAITPPQPKDGTLAISIAFSMSSLLFDPLIQLQHAESGLITEHRSAAPLVCENWPSLWILCEGCSL